MRTFDSGATRDNAEGKLDYSGFLSPQALKAFAEYMHMHRIQADGELRASDNWKKGIPEKAYMESMWRHFWDVWSLQTGGQADVDLKTALCALFFNVQGMLHEVTVKQRNERALTEIAIAKAEFKRAVFTGTNTEWYTPEDLGMPAETEDDWYPEDEDEDRAY